MDASAAVQLERMERYLAGVPGGLEGHPEAQAKGSLVRSALEDQPLGALAGVVPAALRNLVTEPPIGSEWVPETHFTALMYAIADLRRLSDDELRAWARDRNRALFRSPAYKILMAVVSPGAMVRFAGRRWANWHRGTELQVEGIDDDGVALTLRFPDGLFDVLALTVYAEAFCAALEMANARSPAVTLEGHGKDFARYLARW